MAIEVTAYIERWIPHSQIRRALGRRLSSLADRMFLVPGIAVFGAIARLEPGIPTSPRATWSIGPMGLGSAERAAAILTRAHTGSDPGAYRRGSVRTDFRTVRGRAVVRSGNWPAVTSSLSGSPVPPGPWGRGSHLAGVQFLCDPDGRPQDEPFGRPLARLDCDGRFWSPL